MTALYSQYASGTQFSAGIITGSILGTSGLNPIVDRLNSITTTDNAVTGSLVSGTSTKVYGILVSGTSVYGTTLSGINLRIDNVYGQTLISGAIVKGDNIFGEFISGTDMRIDDINATTYVSGPTIIGNTLSGTNIRMNTGIMIGSPSAANHVSTKNYVDANTITLVAGEAIDITNGSEISCEDSTTSNKGVASFNSNDFSVSSGAVSLKNKTSYYSKWAFQEDIFPIELPHSAVVTAAVFFISAGGPSTWTLYREDLDGSNQVTMATAAGNTEDTSISNATIDNNQYKYIMENDSGTSESCRITYTTDYI